MTDKILDLVFIYLGNHIPKYGILNLQRCHYLFPNIEIHLIVDSDVKLSEDLAFIKIFKYSRDGIYKSPIYDLSHDEKFRNGFWFFTMERFEALAAFHQELNPGPVLHLELDVIIFENFPFTSFSSIEKLSWLPYSSNRDCGAILFSPNPDQSKWLIHQMHNEIFNFNNHTDMSVLNSIAVKNPGSFQYLPIFNNMNLSLYNSNLSTMPSNTLRGDFTLNGIQGVFDAAAIGMWLTGIDPRNQYGMTTLHCLQPMLNDSGYVNPSSVKYGYSDELCLYVEDPVGNLTSIFSLHVHSKELKLFDLDNRKRIRRYIDLSHKTKSQLNFFSIKVFLQLIRENFMNRTLFRYLINMPGLVFVKRLIQRMSKLF